VGWWGVLLDLEFTKGTVLELLFFFGVQLLPQLLVRGAVLNRGLQDLNARPGVGEGVLELLKKFTTQTKNWLNGRQFHSRLLFSYSNVLYTVYSHISDS